MAENMGMAGHVDHRDLVLLLGDRDVLVEGIEHGARRRCRIS